ncbi:MAG: hypothetical protein AAF570_26515, partial [Bacteroidota bacterium]
LTQSTVEIRVEPGAFLIAQPFTQMRGAQVLGDTVRHNITLINNGGTLCYSGIVEFNFENGDGYRHTAGDLQFESSRACMAFGKGGKMTIDPGVTLNYGQPGRGMLALRTGGTLDIQKGGELIVHNTLVFGEYKSEDQFREISISLEKGSALRFAPGAHLSNELSQFPEDAVLTVYMNGGVLDDAALPKAERALIRRVYPNKRAESNAGLHVHGNPFADALSFSMVRDAATPFSAGLYTLEGRLVRQLEGHAEAGESKYEMISGDLTPGLYILNIELPEGVLSRKVMRE